MARLRLLSRFLLAFFLGVFGSGSGSHAATRSIPIGVNTQEPAYFDLAHSANIGFVRITIAWSQVNPSAGVWNFSGIDAQVAQANAQGQGVLGILAWVPEWLGGGPHHNRPPLSLVEWEEYVRRVAQRYSGQVEAYEIWNEPNLDDVGNGIGWARSRSQAPTYTDFLRSAAIQIRAWAPGTKVAGPAFSSEANSATNQILQQLQQTNYPDGNASSFLDVFSAHANINGSVGPVDAARLLSTPYLLRTHTGGTLGRVAYFNPLNAAKPVWVTEFGWKSSVVGPQTQREYICKFVKMATGAYRPTESLLDRYPISRVYIYKLVDFGESRGIFSDPSTPKAAVTEYLWDYTFPAIQPPVTSDTSPVNCL